MPVCEVCSLMVGVWILLFVCIVTFRVLRGLCLWDCSLHVARVLFYLLDVV